MVIRLAATISTTAVLGTSMFIVPPILPSRIGLRLMERMLIFSSPETTSVIRFTMPVVSSATMRTEARKLFRPAVLRHRASRTR